MSRPTPEQTKEYIATFAKYIDGKITEEEWRLYTQYFFNEIIITDPEVIAMLKRLKDRD